MVTEQTGLAETQGDGGGTKPDGAVVRDALGVGVAVGLSGFAFGVTSAGSGLSLLQTCALSLLVFTGASQFALVGALAAGGNPFTAAAGAFFLWFATHERFRRLSGRTPIPVPRVAPPPPRKPAGGPILDAIAWPEDRSGATPPAPPSREPPPAIQQG